MSNWINKVCIFSGRKIFIKILINKFSIYLILILLCNSFINTEEQSLNNEKSYEITMIFTGPGRKQIIGNYSDNLPLEVLINGNPQEDLCKSYQLKTGDNIIKLLFNSNLTTFANMFNGITDLKKIDLSNFDTSLITNMEKMFYECINLISINFSKINTTSVENMEYMFYNCKSLKSLDLTKFDTSNVYNMAYMFYSCSSITYLNLNNFDASSVIDISYMFYGCTSIYTIYL